MNTLLKVLRYFLKYRRLPLYRDGKWYRTVLTESREVIRPERITHFTVHAFAPHDSVNRTRIMIGDLGYQYQEKNEVEGASFLFRWNKSYDELRLFMEDAGCTYQTDIHIEDEISHPVVTQREVEL